MAKYEVDLAASMTIETDDLGDLLKAATDLLTEEGWRVRSVFMTEVTEDKKEIPTLV
jgi:hypothetical protein